MMKPFVPDPFKEFKVCFVKHKKDGDTYLVPNMPLPVAYIEDGERTELVFEQRDGAFVSNWITREMSTKPLTGYFEYKPALREAPEGGGGE